MHIKPSRRSAAAIAAAAVPALVLATSLFTTAAHAQLAQTQLDTPANGVTKWLLSDYIISWRAVAGAQAYQMVISDSPTFGNFSETSNTCNSGAAGCFNLHRNSNAQVVTPGELAGFWFLGTVTYHWKVRAWSGTTKGPWSAVRTFSTTNASTRKVLDSALAYVGKAAPPSLSGATWQTDMDGPSGAEIITGTKDYIACGNGPFNGPLSQAALKWEACRSKIRAALQDDGVTEAALTERIGVAFDRATAPPSATPLNDAYLTKLGFRASGKEFADRAMTAGGVTPKSFAATKPTQPRPGLYLFQSTTHAGVIEAVRFLSDGTATVRVIESNYPTTTSGSLNDQWNRPDGAQPWQRVVRGDRQVRIGGSVVAADPTL